MKVLLVGDVVGKGGRKAVRRLVPELRKEFGCAFCIANGENAAGGAGLTENTAMELKSSMVDVVTLGDHVWDQKDLLHQINGLPFVVRPANYHACQPGRGYVVMNIPAGGQAAVINLAGRVFMGAPSDCPFAAADRIVTEVSKRTKTIFVDFHAEATSEKIAMGRYLEGRVTAVWGTHTHVQTADDRVLPEGTAYLTDIGMVGAEDSVLGRSIEAVLHRFTTGMPQRFTVVDEGVLLCGAVVEFDPATGKALSIQRIQRHAPK